MLLPSPSVSPLYHKTAGCMEVTNVGSQPTENSCACFVQEPKEVFSTEVADEHRECKCIIPGCLSSLKMRPLIRRKLRGGGHTVWDWERTMLMITYFRLENIGEESCEFYL